MKARAPPLLTSAVEYEEETVSARAGDREPYSQVFDLATVGVGVGGVGDRRLRQCRRRSKERCV